MPRAKSTREARDELEPLGYSTWAGVQSSPQDSSPKAQYDRLFFTEARPEELTPHVMVLLAQHLARHRLREPQLLEAIAHFLVVEEAQLNSKVGWPPTFSCSSESSSATGSGPAPCLAWLSSVASIPARLCSVPQDICLLAGCPAPIISTVVCLEP